jgi:hypothetical protein
MTDHQSENQQQRDPYAPRFPLSRKRQDESLYLQSPTIRSDQPLTTVILLSLPSSHTLVLTLEFPHLQLRIIPITFEEDVDPPKIVNGPTTKPRSTRWPGYPIWSPFGRSCRAL